MKQGDYVWFIMGQCRVIGCIGGSLPNNQCWVQYNSYSYPCYMTELKPATVEERMLHTLENA